MSVPVYLAAGVKPKELPVSRRDALDDYLAAPFGRKAAAEKALLKYLGPAAS